MSVLDLNALLKPIPGSDPGGPDPRQVRDKDPTRDPTHLLKLRKDAGESPEKDRPAINELPVNEPSRLKYWRDCMKLAQELFATKSKNLDWAIYAVDTATRSAGFAGARDGFQFLTRLTNECWNWLWPRPNLSELEDAEPEDRDALKKELEENAVVALASRYQSLDDSQTGLLFPNVLREWVIAELDGEAASVVACRGAEGRPPKMSSEDLQALARKLGPEKIREALAEIDATLADLETMRAAVEARYAELNQPDLAPTFREVRLALEDCRKVADEMLVAVEGDADPEESSTAAASGDGAAGTAGGVKDKVTRAALYKQISQIADHLSRLEPHSPVPYLLRRVVELQDLPFPELVRQFTYNGEPVLAFLERSLTAAPSGE